ncbi:hypothetical protein Q8W71_17750 [Methylobacterium sp. NEAU 140]|uniref:hypothetical protein n=1 Tax=Methylobacterium sp. NEAU 140 TaxID=3064945 RepID=UPI00273366C7|nr:hypothetical protein [Methylobacterium sp. NEAU 140]MDP4024473.1 hypothetical protein [Methylobacterium sp. NEAU 140]
MSLLSKVMHAFVPAIPTAIPAAQQTASELAQLVTEFREQRAEDFAAMADRAGRSGVRLANAERERDEWRAYARELERLCLGAGLDMPPAPDDD